MKTLYIDIRKFDDAGIGTYIINVVPAVAVSLKYVKIILISCEKGAKRYSYLANENISFLITKAKPFTLKEQFFFLKLKKNAFFWATSLSHPFFRSNTFSTVHDVVQLYLFKKKITTFSKFCTFWFYLYSIASVSRHIFFVSYFTKSEFSRFFNLKSNSFSITHLGSSYKSISFTEKKEKYFLIFGNLKCHKNLHIVLKAWKQISHVYSIKLYVIGGNTPELNRLFSKESLDINSYRILGRIDFYELQSYYRTAKALIFPSLYEGFGLPPLEAASTGCPIICSDIPVMREVYGNLPFYFDPFKTDSLLNSIKAVLELNETDLISLMMQGFNCSRKYSWDCTVSNTMKVIEKILER